MEDPRKTFIIIGESRSYLIQTAIENGNRKAGSENNQAFDVKDNDEEPQLLVDLNPKGNLLLFA